MSVHHVSPLLSVACPISCNMAPAPNSTWNFNEARHGKGTPDGIGANLKGSVDQIVAPGTFIPNATVL